MNGGIRINFYVGPGIQREQSASDGTCPGYCYFHGNLFSCDSVILAQKICYKMVAQYRGAAQLL
jgi:hypothetical protein